jgi:hypothetical protein
VFPVVFVGREKDYRPINTIEYPEEEVAEVEEVLEAPKDSPVPESAESSTSEITTTSELPETPASDASVEKDSGQLKEPESGSPTSSLLPMIGEIGLPASEPLPDGENQTPGSQAKQS